MAEINPKFVTNLKGRSYATYAGALDLATQLGIKSLVTEIVQIPAQENQFTAVVMATLEMADGRTFKDVGDASPQNCSAQVANALLRMASARSKGRVLRDACNIGEALLEEIHETDGEPMANRFSAPAGGSSAPVAWQKPPSASGGTASNPPQGTPMFCSFDGCGVRLTPGQVEVSVRAYGKALCPHHQRKPADG